MWLFVFDVSLRGSSTYRFVSIGGVTRRSARLFFLFLYYSLFIKRQHIPQRCTISTVQTGLQYIEQHLTNSTGGDEGPIPVGTHNLGDYKYFTLSLSLSETEISSQETVPKPVKMVLGKKVIGVFSRESQESYQWFINFLLTLSGVSDVRPVYISNNSDQDFRNELRKCQFCVLYHSKNRGRVNVTDVTDSLYDKELETLCTTHGKSNVIVVIDDLEDSREPVRSQILEHQPSIGKLARDLFLFSAEEKRQYNEEPSYQNASFANGKLRKIKDIINGSFTIETGATLCTSRNRSKWVFLGVVVFLIVIAIILLIIYVPHK
uniref:Uncharacterized protein n=1 Tax=Leptobrachium leishanense TaxID=445787 RepID=A0A8C5MM03_9ANUR